MLLFHAWNICSWGLLSVQHDLIRPTCRLHVGLYYDEQGFLQPARRGGAWKIKGFSPRFSNLSFSLYHIYKCICPEVLLRISIPGDSPDDET